MSVSRILVTIFVVTYGTNAAFWYDKTSNKYSVSADDDINDDYFNEDYNGETYDSEDINNVFSDYNSEENNNYYNKENAIEERQLPESGEAKTKKSQTWCKVKKVTQQHYERGYEFFPKSYTEYDCVKNDVPSDNAIYSHDACPVHHGHCVPMQKQYYFMKRKLTERCWKLDVRTVKVGCKCIPPSPIF